MPKKIRSKDKKQPPQKASQYGQRVVVAFLVIVITIVAIFGINTIGHSSQEESNQLVLSPTLLSRQIDSTSRSKQIEPASKIAPRYSAEDIDSFPNLPNTTLKVTDDWGVQVESFGSKGTLKAPTTYFGSGVCEGANCQAVLLNQPGIQLSLVTDAVMDNHGVQCSNSLAFVPIGKGWYRINDSKGYLYTRNLEQNAMGSEFQQYGSFADEWSSIQGQKYKFCLGANGTYFERKIGKNKTTPEPEEYAILLEYPRLTGQPTPEQLRQADEVVRSIGPMMSN